MKRQVKLEVSTALGLLTNSILFNVVFFAKVSVELGET